jgi:hypothetical protein
MAMARALALQAAAGRGPKPLGRPPVSFKFGHFYSVLSNGILYLYQFDSQVEIDFVDFRQW